MGIIRELDDFFKISVTKVARIRNIWRPAQLSYAEVSETRNRRVALVLGVAACAIIVCAKSL